MFIGAALLLGSSAVFAAPQTAAHPAGQAPAASTAPAAKHDLKYEKHQIRVEEKTALASCKTMKGAQKSACRKDAIAKASNARADLKAAKHA
jgi:hypothetical protein